MQRQIYVNMLCSVEPAVTFLKRFSVCVKVAYIVILTENKVLDEDADRRLELHEHVSSRRRRCMSRLAFLSQVLVGGVLIWALSFLQAPR